MLKTRRSTLPFLSALLLAGSLASIAPSAAAQTATPTVEPSQDEALEVGGDVLKPVKISGDAPQCHVNQMGTIDVKGVLDKQGNLGRLKVVKSIDPAYDACVLKTLRTWKFKPATKNGEPVAVKYEFTLQSRRTT